MKHLFKVFGMETMVIYVSLSKLDNFPYFRCLIMALHLFIFTDIFADTMWVILFAFVPVAAFW